MAKPNKKQRSIRPKGNVAEQMISDLLSLKGLLGKHMAAHINDLGLLDTAITAIYDERIPEEWSYEINRLIFKNLDLDRDGTSENAFLELTIQISGFCQEPNPIHDLLNSYCLRFVLKHKVEEDIELKDAFRFERHIYSDSDGTPEFLHPLYHFQYGGYEVIEDEDFDKGHVLFVDAPRIMHPPMDIVLAIDFVIGNFYSSERDEVANLFQDSGYKDVVINARKRFWKPYSLGLASNFTTNFNFVTENAARFNSTYCRNIIMYKKEHQT